MVYWSENGQRPTIKLYAVVPSTYTFRNTVVWVYFTKIFLGCLIHNKIISKEYFINYGKHTFIYTNANVLHANVLPVVESSHSIYQKVYFLGSKSTQDQAVGDLLDNVPK